MNEVIVRGKASGLEQDIQIGDHQLTGDEPVDQGGGNAGPDPYAYLLTALGTCTSMTLRMYADRKGWPLEGVTVKLSHDKIHARDCADCETRIGRIDRIERRIELRGPLDGDQRAQLMKIAEKCPVHRTLTSEIRIESTLV